MVREVLPCLGLFCRVSQGGGACLTEIVERAFRVVLSCILAFHFVVCGDVDLIRLALIQPTPTPLTSSTNRHYFFYISIDRWPQMGGSDGPGVHPQVLGPGNGQQLRSSQQLHQGRGDLAKIGEMPCHVGSDPW